MTAYADGPDTEFDEWKKTGGYGMAKEQLAAVEMIMGMIQGKTEGLSKVDFIRVSGKDGSGTGRYSFDRYASSDDIEERESDL